MRPLLARFESSSACRNAILGLKERGWDHLEAFMPYPEKSVEKALGAKRSPLPRLAFAAGLAGGLIAYFVQWFTNAVDYPLNVAGRPNHAVLAFIPLTFETTVLFAGATSFLFGFLLSGLPRYYDPLFEVPDFERVMVDGWFVAVLPPKNSQSAPLDRIELGQLLSDFGARSVTEFGDGPLGDGPEEES